MEEPKIKGIKPVKLEEPNYQEQADRYFSDAVKAMEERDEALQQLAASEHRFEALVKDLNNIKCIKIDTHFGAVQFASLVEIKTILNKHKPSPSGE